MLKRMVSRIMLTLVFIGMLTLAFNIQPVKASGTIYIRADGSVDPDTAPISSDDDVTYTFTGNISDGIVVERSNIIIDGAGYSIRSTGIGIDLPNRSNVIIKNINIEGFYGGYGGIRLYQSFNIRILGNNITGNSWYGISLYKSSYNILKNNHMVDNEANFGVSGSELSHFLHDVDASNTVDGKPIYYWINKQDMVVPLDAGYVALVNCTGITAQNLHLTKNKQGVLLAGTTNSTITKSNITKNQESFTQGILLWDSSNNTITGNSITAIGDTGLELYHSSNNRIVSNNITNNGHHGIYFYYSSNSTISGNNITNNNNRGVYFYRSSNNTVSGNNITNNDCGIDLDYSSNNTVSGNTVTNSFLIGIHLWWSNGSTFTGNTISENYVGMALDFSEGNIIYHNNFVVDNIWYQVFSCESTNVWDDDYPSGGNYWSDHVCTGNPSDGSQPYIIDENNIDHYPFQDLNGWLLPQLTQLTVTSSPVTGITFTINGAPKTTPYTEWLLEGSYTLEMREAHNGYVWSHWLEDGDPNRTKTVTLPGTTWTGVFVFAVQPHGPEAEFEAIPDTALTGESIKFDASASLLGWNGTHEMPIVEYRWDFGGAIKITTPTPILYYSFISPGIYYVTLTVYAPGATPETDSTTKKVTITAMPVGGYSFPIEVHTKANLLTPYIALLAILTVSFTMIERKTRKRTKRP